MRWSILIVLLLILILYLSDYLLVLNTFLFFLGAYLVTSCAQMSVFGGSFTASTSLSRHIPLPSDGKIRFDFYNTKQNLHHQRNQSFISSLDSDVVNLFEKGQLVPIAHIDEKADTAEFSATLASDAPRLAYRRRKNEFKLALHWGQLKLMLSEIEFLTLACTLQKSLADTRDIYFIYAGSAPGHHIEYLHSLFPTVHFELYDPNDFFVKENSHIRIHQQFFLDADAAQWSTEGPANSSRFIIFCSDIRTEPATDETVKENMAMQRKWWELMNPELSMFKFRLPHEQPADSFTEYPLGDIYIQPYPGPTSTETRLIVKKDAPLHRYNNLAYEEQMFYHNSVVRKCRFDSPLGHASIDADGLDNCYDCTRFYNIVAAYHATQSDSKTDDVLQTIDHIQTKIMHGESIKKKTIASLYKYLFTLYARSFKDCRKPKCQLCRVSRGDHFARASTSRATNENLRKAQLLTNK